MLAEARRRQLIGFIAQRGFASLEELVGALGVSESTVRRDLESLDADGKVKRTHGGAVCTGDVLLMPALDEREGTSAPEKQAIGRAAANLVGDGDTVLLDGGTTTLEVARALVGRPVQVVTNSLPIAQLLTASKETDLILIGGYVYPRTGVAMGPLAIATMKGLRAHKVIMGAGGVVAEGIFNSNSLLVETERTMMACAQEVVLVADGSKFGRLSLSRLCGLEEIGRLITDPSIPDEYRVLFDAAKVPVHVATTPQANGHHAQRNGA